ncbi:MAG: hypothetical protein LH614_12700 [Pyrinomonadaceae bacterium]|nr:hypothetical protein [Pyrinomonadaceae bacterium]
MSEREANAIFRRLSPMPTAEFNKSDFQIRADSPPPPKTGKVIPIKFPDNENRISPDGGTENSSVLEVVRFSPSGKVAFAPDLSVTFSQPMIAVSSLKERKNDDVPVKLSPNVKGRWRWLGTKTLIFDAETRFPMATTFTTVISAGTKSATGGSLVKEISWTFSTPPPKVESFTPSNKTVKNDALLLAVFDQEINAGDVLAKTTAFSFNRKISLRLAKNEEIASDEEIVEATKNLLPNRWIAFHAVDPLPPDALVVINFNAGTPSAEGSLTTAEAQFFAFKTFGTLKFEKSYCGYSEDEKNCRSFQDWKIVFNNSLDEKAFDKSQVKIEPDIANADISAAGDSIEISGLKDTRRNYKVTVAGSLKDEFGNNLGKDISAVFRIGADDAELSGSGGEFITLDPNGNPEFSVYSINYPNLNVKLYAVKTADYGTFQTLRRSNENAVPVIGKLLYEKSVKIKSAPDAATNTTIDLSPALKKGIGQAILVVESPNKVAAPVVKWLQKTNIGVDAFADYEKLIVFTSDLKSGKPLPDAQLSLSNGASGASDQNGLARINLPLVAEDKGDWLVASHDSDSAILFADDDGDGANDWSNAAAKDDLRWFVFNDRNLYRPGETVSVKGYIRKITGGITSDVGELADAARDLSYVLKDSRGSETAKGTAQINAFGAFDLKLSLPKNTNLGGQRLELKTESALESKQFTHYFQVQEFRRPEFEVTTTVENAAPFYIGETAHLKTEAKYYSGGFLSNAAAVWNITAEPTNYTPPNREDYTFGKFVPWWRSSPADRDAVTTKKFSGTTGADGAHRIALDFTAANPARPFTVKAEAKVQDVNRQTFAAATNLLVHSSELYVGIRTPKTFIRQDEKFAVETLTTDVDGKAVADAPVSIVAELQDWRKIEGEWRQITIDRQTCQIKSGDAPVSCEVFAKQGGIFAITANVEDRRGRRSESELTVWAAGGNSEPTREIEREEVILIPDKKAYAPHETAEILVNSPFTPAEGVLTLRRGGIVKAERFTMNEASTILQIPIEEGFLPNIHVQVDLVGTSPRVVYEDERDAKLPKRPAFAGGELNLDVSTATRQLNVAAQPTIKTLEPGGATQINIAVKDWRGIPAANAEVAVVAVDESVLALTNYKIADPLAVFYQKIEAETIDYHSRENIQLSYPADIGIGNGYGSGNGYGNGSGSPKPPQYLMSLPFRVITETTGKRKLPIAADLSDQIRLRSNFDALAIFAPSVKTDGGGNAVVNLKLPDNLTRYRITATAATKAGQFGSGESNITARQSLMVRPSAPRFMNFGDRIELPVVLQNQTNEAMTVEVAVRAANAHLTAGNGRKITIAANDRAEIRFPVAADKAGTARFQIGAVAGEYADAAEFEFPVHTPATSEAVAVYGTTDGSGAIVQPIETPKDVYAEFGGLEISTSSTQLQELTDAFIYLQNYPFECTEQISSRILSVAALRDVLNAFDAAGLPPKNVIEAKMKSDIERLVKLQHGDGGFSFWRGDDEGLPYVSVHAAHALARAQANGDDVPTVTIAKSLVYLKNIEAKYPDFYSRKARWAISAYALSVRSLLGDKDYGKARKLLQEATLENLSLEADGWLLSVLAEDVNSSAQVESIKRHLLNRATETAGAAHFTTDYEDGEYVLLSSERRADGVILESLLKADPKNDLIPKIVRGLLAGKTSGRWSNTQENAFILLALDRYFQVYESVAPDFVTRIWLGKALAGKSVFAGRSVDSTSINVPMNYLQSQPNSNLILDKTGGGRLYYRIGLNYAPKNLRLESADDGLAVTRTYEAIDAPADVRQNADRSWTFKSGARIRVRIQMVAPTRRYHVALVDRLPAGLEIINSELANYETSPKDKIDDLPNNADYYFRNRRWFEQQNLRDDRAEAFTTLLPAGVWNYSYLARATTPGSFIVPPAKAEEMYSPETFGRTKTDFVVVE